MKIPIQLDEGGRYFQCDHPIYLSLLGLKKDQVEGQVFSLGMGQQLEQHLKGNPSAFLISFKEGEVTAYTYRTERSSKKPSLLEKAVSFVDANVAEVRAIFHGEAPVSEEVVVRRLEICRGCEEYDNVHETCKRCGCILRWKTAYRSTSCPLGKW